MDAERRLLLAPPAAAAHLGGLALLAACLAVPAWATWGNVQQGRWLLAGVVLLPAACAVLTLLDGAVRRELLPWLGELLLACLGGRREACARPGPDGGQLELATRLGRLRVGPAPIPWSQVVRIDVSGRQGGGFHVCVEELSGATTFLGGGTEAAARQLAETLEGWRLAALAGAEPGLRCSLCRAALADEVRTCPGCGTRTHPSCREELGACPSLGCPEAAGSPPGREDELSLPGPRPGLALRLGAALFLGAGLLAVALVVQAATRRGAAPEGLAGLLLGLLTWPWLLIERGEVLQLLLGARLVLRRDGRRWRLALRLGPLLLPLRRLEVPAGSRARVVETVLGVRTLLLVPPDAVGRGREVLARGLSLTDARRAERVLGGWLGDPGPAPSAGDKAPLKERGQPGTSSAAPPG